MKITFTSPLKNFRSEFLKILDRRTLVYSNFLPIFF
uniref:Uncharacterized protein n=1 Tax=Siphoviridae sp. ctHjK2 TaxID=2827831 RepID=A0A8S5SQJ6_9CAUD|nr:MAG TPA: hypothetical protein [Siphoviridae sp. ctHjK2]